LPRLLFSRRAEELFRSLSPGAQETLDRAFLRLRIDPKAAGVELEGTMRGTWRMREGAYRVLYKIRDGGSTVVVESIRHRGTAYPRRRK
jgi:mRNA-degrading endonuclease RelE of RelBE toxin-antitoxin system